MSKYSAGDKIIFVNTENTRRHCINNATGFIESIDGDIIFCIYTGSMGLAGPFELTEDDVKKEPLCS